MSTSRLLGAAGEPDAEPGYYQEQMQAALGRLRLAEGELVAALDPEALDLARAGVQRALEEVRHIIRQARADLGQSEPPARSDGAPPPGYWRNRAERLRLWLRACRDRDTEQRLLAALQEAEAEEEQVGGLRLYVVRRTRTAGKGAGRRAGHQTMPAG